LQAFAGVGVTLGGLTGCQCAADIVGTNLLNIGPVQFVNGGTCKGGGIGFNYGVGASTVVGAQCSTKLVGCMF
jgi:hypothetical protein